MRPMLVSRTTMKTAHDPSEPASPEMLAAMTAALRPTTPPIRYLHHRAACSDAPSARERRQEMTARPPNRSAPLSATTLTPTDVPTITAATTHATVAVM